MFIHLGIKHTGMRDSQRTIPVYEGTRDRVRELKGNRSYDEIIAEWAAKYETEQQL